MYKRYLWERIRIVSIQRFFFDISYSYIEELKGKISRYEKATRFFKTDRTSDRCTQSILTKPLAAIMLYVTMLAPICAFTDANWCRSCHSCVATVGIGSVSIGHWPEIIAPPTKVSRSLFQYIRTEQRVLLKRRSFRAACLGETSATSKCSTDDQESIAGLSLFEM